MAGLQQDGGIVETQTTGLVRKEARWRDTATAGGRLEPPAAGRGRKDPDPEPLEGAQPCDTWISGLCLSVPG